MIRSIRSNRPSFKSIVLKPGLNIILASKVEDSIDEVSHRTRNGAGKSSIIDIVRFVFGSSPKKGEDVLASEELQQDSFSIDFDMNGKSCVATRSLAQKQQIEVVADEYANLVEAPTINEDGLVWYGTKSWSRLLANEFFALPTVVSDEGKNNLSNASLLSYLTRRARDGAFGDWVRTHRGQSLNKQAVPLFYLLGLDYTAPLEYMRYAEAKAGATELRKAAKDGVLAEFLGNRSTLRNELVKARSKFQRASERRESKSILQFYGEYENEAATIDQKIREASNENFIDASLIGRCVESIKEENTPEVSEIELLYRDAGVHFSEKIRKRFDEVQSFHNAVIKNRKSHLQSEIDSARSRIEKRNDFVKKSEDRLLEIRELLSGSIALGDYRKIERELATLESEQQSLEKKLDLVDKFEQALTNSKEIKLKAERLLEGTFREQEEIILQAISIFQSISSVMYDEPASFDIEKTAEGPRFKISEAAIASEGINNMQIFTFDLMLAIMAHESGRWPGFLFHDSHIFDGVDGRQAGCAIRIAKNKIEEINGQYIVTLNSDDYEKIKRESGEDFDSCIIDPHLDDSKNGGLFGFRFERDINLSDGD